jgi:KDO2-lipid IV(A) lauroyltransferase
MLLARLPLPILYFLAWPIGLLAYFLKNNQRHICEVNLQLCFPQWSSRQRQAICRRNMVETVKNLFESLKLWQAKDQKILGLVRQVSNDHLLIEALQANKGVILIIPHLGNWEVVNLYCSSRFSVTGLYRPQKSPGLDKLMREGRQRFGTKALPATGQGVRGLLKALKQNGLVIILPDQNPGKGTGIFAPFFGIAANTPVLPARLAHKTHAAVISAYAERLPLGKGYHIHFGPMSADIDQVDTVLATTSMNADLEQLVRKKPEQYWWGYSRFRRRPAGEPRLYQKD